MTSASITKYDPSTGRDGNGEDTERKLHLDKAGISVQPPWSQDEHDWDPHQEPGPPETEAAAGAETAAAAAAGGTGGSC